MKPKRIDLDLDFIGGLGSLTTEEEKALSEYFKQHKLSLKKPGNKKLHRTSKRQKVTN